MKIKETCGCGGSMEVEGNDAAEHVASWRIQHAAHRPNYSGPVYPSYPVYPALPGYNPAIGPVWVSPYITVTY